MGARIVAGLVALGILFMPSESGWARLIRGYSAQELFDQADLVVVARATANHDLPGPCPEFPALPDSFVGVDTDLEIGGVFKGDKTLRKIVFHHLRYSDHPGGIVDGPTLIAFEVPDGPQYKWYLFFLKRASDGHYVPAIDQTDPWGRDVLELDRSFGLNALAPAPPPGIPPAGGPITPLPPAPK